MTPADRIISKFGGLRPTARKLGMASHTTVQRWQESGFIPMRYAASILAAGADLPDPVVPADFVPASSAQPERATAL